MTLVSGIVSLAQAIAAEIKNNIRPRLQPTGGALGTVLTKQSTNPYDSAWAPLPGLTLIGGAPTVLTGSGTFAKDTRAKLIQFELIGAGGPGASGTRADLMAVRSGGNGGAGGCITREIFPADDVAASCSYVIPVGPNGGAAVTTNTTAGLAGSKAVTTRIGVNSRTTLRAQSGAPGPAGNLMAAGTGAPAITGFNEGQFPNCNGGGAPQGAAGAVATQTGHTGPGGGGGGGGNKLGGGFSAGGAGTESSSMGYTATASTTTNAATTAGAAGTAGISLSNPQWGGGGGGGASSDTGAGGKGGDGGFPGGGGGGGGSGIDGFTGGAGGKGGDGAIRVWQWF